MALVASHREGPVDQVGDDDRFRIHARMEIVGLLRSVATHRELVTIQYGGAQDFVVSAVLDVDTDQDLVVLDYGADRNAMQRLLQSPRLRVMTQLDHVRIQFQAAVAGEATYDGGAAFCVRIPESVLRFQRRDAYRLKIPLGRPVMCEVPASEGQPKRVSIRVRDISVAGVGLMDYPKDFKPASGSVWTGCRIDLPGAGALVADVEVMHVEEGDVRRCGCRFRNLPLPMANLIQRYITRVEREQYANR
jgi:c-di-GMP-binding flagellar brake protein YcgR